MATDQGIVQTVQLLQLKRLWAQPWFSLPDINGTGETNIENVKRDSEGVIAVTVKVEGVAQSNIRVRLFHRLTNSHVKWGFTDANGLVTFDRLDRNAIGEFYLVAFSEADYNALIYDKLTPA